MARWKLSRLTFGNEEFTLCEGEEVFLGRGVNNTIPLASIVVSRNHCHIKVEADKVYITDLKSSNGIYVGLKKIPPSTPFCVEDSDIIGIGWTQGAHVGNIEDSGKYMFKLTKEKPPSINSRITFQGDEGDIESELAAINGARSSNEKSVSPPVIAKSSMRKLSSEQNETSKNNQSPIHCKAPVKRKLETENSLNNIEIKQKKQESNKYKINDEIINILSDSEEKEEIPSASKKIKAEPNCGTMAPPTKETDIKTEREDLDYDAFKVKQEYLEDEPIQIDSDSDDESVQWFIRLSQNSPGKPFIKAARESKVNIQNEENSYSQIDDFEDDYTDDLITIVPPPPDKTEKTPECGLGDKNLETKCDAVEDEEDYLDDLISLYIPPGVPSNISEKNNIDVLDKNLSVVPESKSTVPLETHNKNEQGIVVESINQDFVDGSINISSKHLEINLNHTTMSTNKNRKARVEPEALAQIRNDQPNPSTLLINTKHKSSPSSSTSSKNKKNKHKNHSTKVHITNSQKEERKKKLKEIAEKEKNQSSSKHTSSSSKGIVSAKVTSTNRGAFLTDVVQGVVKPMNRKEIPKKLSENKEKNDQKPTNESAVLETSDNTKNQKDQSGKSSVTTAASKEPIEDIENKKKQSDRHSSSKHKEKDKTSKDKGRRSSKSKEKEDTSKTKSTHSKSRKSSTEVRIPLKSLKPLSESEESFSGKPFSKVEPMKPRKSVRFSEEPPVVHLFEIEEGNSMKKTSLVKSNLVDVRQAPVFSLEKITLMKILRWNPQWLEEQICNNDPPPILGSNDSPMTIFHSFSNHEQYVQVVGDLLLMEIWECLTQGYMRVRNQAPGIQMRIASLPPISTQDRCFELCNLSVNVSVPNTEIRSVPRLGEIILVSFGPEMARNKRFFYVHNVRTLPSPANNRNSFFCISLHTCYTDKMKTLKPGELMIGVTLSYIQTELMLFEAMEHLAGSPLSEAILKPEPRHFIKCNPNSVYPDSEWTGYLNPSQKLAVHSSVAAALSDRPSIQMVQGPPGTGKSSVICAMVMTYFYDCRGRRQANRGKILICATSNAAVDELVLRLLQIRQQQPRNERFRMVRVGRAEAMHPKARDISSQQLALRDAAARQSAETLHPGLNEEISHLEAKINMWRTQEQDAKDPVRAAYCKGRVKALCDRIALLQGGSGGGCGAGAGAGAAGAEQLAAIERRIIEGADIIVTTLASAHNHKMRVLRRRIALCIVDEAGQAIEPEALIPLTLDVTHLALVGDPQQLPGFICSQRAKKLGLGESLFYRLTSCSDQWGEGSPVILLNQQYRMQTEIADYPNRAFYASRIQSVPPPRPNIDVPPYSIVCISSGDKGQGSSGANEMEAWGVARLVLALNSMLKPLNLNLAVITPYNAHKDLIKKNLRLLQEPSESHIEVNTVDSFQGQERDVVVASLARSQGLGFLSDAGRMNVMLTRARHALLLCLNPHAMLKNYQWRTLVEDAQKRNLYRILPHKICQGTSAGPIPHAEVLNHIIQKFPKK